MSTEPIPTEPIHQRILLLRGCKVMSGTRHCRSKGGTARGRQMSHSNSLAANEFPNKDFMFQVTEKEKAEVVANCDHLLKLKFSPMLPYAFTEHARVSACPPGFRAMNSSAAEEFIKDKLLIGFHARDRQASYLIKTKARQASG